MVSPSLGEEYRKNRIEYRKATADLKTIRKEFFSSANDVIGNTRDFRNKLRKLREDYKQNFNGFDAAIKEWIAKCDEIKAQQKELDAAKAAGDDKQAKDIEKAMQANDKAAKALVGRINEAIALGPDYEKKAKGLKDLADALGKAKPI